MTTWEDNNKVLAPPTFCLSIPQDVTDVRKKSLKKDNTVNCFRRLVWSLQRLAGSLWVRINFYDLLFEITGIGKLKNFSINKTGEFCVQIQIRMSHSRHAMLDGTKF